MENLGKTAFVSMLKSAVAVPNDLSLFPPIHSYPLLYSMGVLFSSDCAPCSWPGFRTDTACSCRQN